MNLTLPGTLPGLLRRGSPVVMTVGTITHAGVLLSSGPYGATVAHSNGHNWRKKPIKPWPLERVALDLTDKTGRAHAAWWLAERLGLEALRTGVVAIRLQDVTEYSPDGRAVAFRTGVVWALGDERYDIGTPEVLAALADLDPHDPRLLEDGSRWVDAEALRLVALHVAGGGQ